MNLDSDLGLGVNPVALKLNPEFQNPQGYVREILGLILVSTSLLTQWKGLLHQSSQVGVSIYIYIYIYIRWIDEQRLPQSTE